MKLKAPYLSGMTYIQGKEYSISNGFIDVPENLVLEIIGRPGYSFIGDDAANYSNVKTKGSFKRIGPSKIGFWQSFLKCYGGGEVYFYQCSINLAIASNNEVFYITNDQAPKWASEYPSLPNHHVVVIGKDPVPDDLNVIVTDYKWAIKSFVSDYWNKHNREIPLICCNFESANWIAKYLPVSSLIEESKKEFFKLADCIYSCSEIGDKEAIEWLGVKKPSYVVHPVVNYGAIKDHENIVLPIVPKRAYALWIGRSDIYKGGQVAVDAVFDLDIPLDFVGIGEGLPQKQETSLHKMHFLQGVDSRTKFAYIQNASVVIAPSIFEGFGMVPAEALCFGTPCLVYDLPVLRKYYGDRIKYAEWNNKNDFTLKLKQIVSTPKPSMEKEKTWARSFFSMKRMREELIKLPYLSDNIIKEEKMPIFKSIAERYDFLVAKTLPLVKLPGKHFYADSLPIDKLFPAQNREEMIALLGILERETIKNVLEIGTLCGGWAYIIASWILPEKLICVDMDFTPFQRHLFPGQCTPQEITGSSFDKNIIDRVKKEMPIVDLLHIDGDHTYKGAKADWDNYSPLVRPNGIIVIHDTHLVQDPDVAKFFKEVSKDHMTIDINSPGGQGIGIVVKN